MEIKRIGLSELQLITDLFNKYRMFYGQHSNIILAESYLHERLLHNESIIFAAIDEQQKTVVPAGFTQLYPSYSSVSVIKNWTLNDLFIEEHYRRQGIGKMLIAAAINFAARQGAAFIQLETAPENYTARSLYEATGFTQFEPYKDMIVYKTDIPKAT